MGYVMIPVPEDHVEAVMQFVLREIARASLEDWDADTISQTFDETDEATRSLLAFVARAAGDGLELTDVEVAGKIQLTVREVLGIVNELSALTRGANRPTLVATRAITERLPNGRTTDKRVLQMTPDVADLVRAAEQAELAQTPHPLAEGDG